MLVGDSHYLQHVFDFPSSFPLVIHVQTLGLCVLCYIEHLLFLQIRKDFFSLVMYAETWRSSRRLWSRPRVARPEDHLSVRSTALLNSFQKLSLLSQRCVCASHCLCFVISSRTLAFLLIVLMSQCAFRSLAIQVYWYFGASQQPASSIFLDNVVQKSRTALLRG